MDSVDLSVLRLRRGGKRVKNNKSQWDDEFISLYMRIYLVYVQNWNSERSRNLRNGDLKDKIGIFAIPNGYIDFHGLRQRRHLRTFICTKIQNNGSLG